MTVTQAPPIPFGRHLGAAHRGARALLDDVLVREATTYETWITLNLLATSGSAMGRDDFARTLGAALQIGDTATAQLLGQLESFGVICQDSVPGEESLRMMMTATGEQHFQRMLAAVNLASGQALSEVDPGDVQTTIRVLGQFQERIGTMLAG